jgi:hypothetical protein
MQIKVDTMGDYHSHTRLFFDTLQAKIHKNIFLNQDLLWLKMIINFRLKKLPINQSKEKKRNNNNCTKD